MRMTRVRTKDSKLIVNIISADGPELMMLSKVLSDAATKVKGYCLVVELLNPDNRVLILNDKIFEHIDETGLLKRDTKDPVYKYIDAHIIKWGIKPPKKGKTPKKKPKDNKKRFKIEVE